MSARDGWVNLTPLSDVVDAVEWAHAMDVAGHHPMLAELGIDLDLLPMPGAFESREPLLLLAYLRIATKPELSAAIIGSLWAVEQ